MEEFEKMLTDFLKESNTKQHINPKTRDSSFRHKAKKKRTQERLKVIEYGYKPSIGCDKGGYWVGAQNSNMQRWLKRQSNKKVRRTTYIGQHGSYKKLYDYWNRWF